MVRERLAVGLVFLMMGPGVARCLAQESAPPAAPVEVTESAPAPSGTLDLSSASAPLPDDFFAARQPGFDAPVGDGRRTLSAFPKNLGRGFIGVFSRDSLAPFLIGVSAAGSSHQFDQRVGSWLDGKCVSCGSAGATAGGAAVVVPVVGALFVAGRFAPEGRFRAMSYDAAQVLAVNAAWTGALKYSLHRQRPDASDSFSLPSGHSSSAFALATVAEHHYGWKVGVPAYLLAAGIGLSRVESNRHHFSDVIAGGALGLTVGRAVTRVNGQRPAGRRTLSVGPATDPRGGGIGLGLSASW